MKKENSTYSPHTGAIYLDNGFYLIKEIGSGITTQLVVVFETPTESETDTYTLSVKGGTMSSKKDIVLLNK